MVGCVTIFGLCIGAKFRVLRVVMRKEERHLCGGYKRTTEFIRL
jgi:hypothetical protein